MAHVIASVGILVIKDNKVLLGKRLSKHGQGTWGPPGGKLDFGEKLIDCAVRECYEETGLKIKNLKEGPITNNIFEGEGLHSISIFFITKDFEGEPKVMEPDKCEKWDWFSWNNIPKPLFVPLAELIKMNYKLE